MHEARSTLHDDNDDDDDDDDNFRKLGNYCEAVVQMLTGIAFQITSRGKGPWELAPVVQKADNSMHQIHVNYNIHWITQLVLL